MRETNSLKYCEKRNGKTLSTTYIFVAFLKINCSREFFTFNKKCKQLIINKI